MVLPLSGHHYADTITTYHDVLESTSTDTSEVFGDLAFRRAHTIIFVFGYPARLITGWVCFWIKS